MSLPPLVANQHPMSARVVDDLVRLLLVRLADVEHPTSINGGFVRCVLCDAFLDGGEHDDTCPWRQARELLGYPGATR